jgi:NAD(P)-dependent dehydrogenase (short-subunit alcohol dehydrogenase family)
MSEEARYPELEKQSVIVTGGTRGIGLGIVRVLARAGVQLTITGRKQERLDAVAAEPGHECAVLSSGEAAPRDRIP